MGSYLPPSYNNANANRNSYDPRTATGSSIVSSQGSSSGYYYHNSSFGKQPKPNGESNRVSVPEKQVPLYGVAPKPAQEVAITIDSNPFFMTRAVVNNANDQVAIDTNLLQAAAQYSGVGSAATASTHRKFGSVQYGVTRMY